VGERRLFLAAVEDVPDELHAEEDAYAHPPSPTGD
jgi:hypothetical protein